VAGCASSKSNTLARFRVPGCRRARDCCHAIGNPPATDIIIAAQAAVAAALSFLADDRFRPRISGNKIGTTHLG